MTPAWSAAFWTLLLAFGFASLGEILLRRESRTAACWNESFLVGAGAAASLLFPLSLLLPSGALTATIALLALAAVSRVARLPRRPAEPGGFHEPWDGTQRAALALIAVCAATFFVLNALASLGWDGFQIWATRALVLEERGALSPERWPETGLIDRLINYPPLVPLYEALVARLRGGFDFETLKPIFDVFYVSLLVGTFAMARRFVTRRLALAATALVALLPAVSTAHNAGGYADLPMAAFVAAAAAAAVAAANLSFPPARPGPEVWLAGSLLAVKNEGILLLAVFAGATLVLWIIQRERGPDRLRRNAASLLLLASMIGLRLGYLAWVGRPEPSYRDLNAASVAAALGRVRQVALLCGARLLEWRVWGLFWPAFVLSLFVLLRRGRLAERAIALAVVGAAILYAGPYLFTTWPIELHVAQSFPRLMEQVAPLAAVSIAAAYARSTGEPFVERSRPPGGD